ncbi:hypothetical protein L0P88_06990 [Muricauda sp. SCSIO 64092]|uniref:hypothetical protein n=1 Tax=Allomuricauda sp. SCSIO 64092 TaxID=2908842 RepID=UPI001FF1F43D|nr:hypothetical protein [Muricauda sp. SCSIO 64092]UOY08292.1 hypothetical protein L0P88_06990 [Muricauda sp. SCSIO 64092]
MRVRDNKTEIEPMTRSTCIFRDELVIQAGILMGFTVTLTNDFYRYRHKKL